MKIPQPLLQFAPEIALRNAGVVVATPLNKIPHIDVIAKAWTDGEPLEVIIGLYLQATQTLADDEIAGKVAAVIEFINVEIPEILKNFSTRPARDVIARLLGGLSIPDFNDVAGDETLIIDVINQTMNELV